MRRRMVLSHRLTDGAQSTAPDLLGGLMTGRFRQQRALYPRASAALAAEPIVQPVQVEIDDRRRVEGEYLANQQPADHGEAEPPAKSRPPSAAEHQRQAAEQGAHGGHHDRPEA